ncbi:MAG: hypothetical protein HFJ05_11170 [Eubacterium sp.]|nr:hypothetical protein [Eubacterium sp.]
MNRKMYRLCLVMVIMAAVVSGILYYRVLKKKIDIPKEGVFVWEELTGSGCV